MLERRNAIQREHDRLERWTCVNLMNFIKAKCKVLHRGQGNPKPKYRLGRECTESNPEEKDLVVLVDEKLDLAVCARSPERRLYPGLHQRKHGQQVKRGDSATLLCFGVPSRSAGKGEGELLKSLCSTESQ